MALFRDKGHDVRLAVAVPVGEYLRAAPSRAWRERRKTVRERYGLPLDVLVSPPSRFAGLWSEGFALRRLIKRHHCPNGTILHCRGPLATRVALDARQRAGNVRVIFDCRGLAFFETIENAGYERVEDAPSDLAARARRLDTAERRAARESDAVVAVSRAMKKVMVARWGVTAEKVHVIPCCTDVDAGRQAYERRDETRARLQLSHKWVVVYNGSLAPYQMIDQTLALVVRLLAARKDGHFLAITTSPGKMREKIKSWGIDAARCTVLNVPQHQVAENLAAADLSILLRAQNMTNKVASPVKFAEYLAVGVPVMITPMIGDYSEITIKQSVGLEVSEPCDKLDIREICSFPVHLPHFSPENCISFASTNLDISVAVENLRAVYQSCWQSANVH